MLYPAGIPITNDDARDLATTLILDGTRQALLVRPDARPRGYAAANAFANERDRTSRTGRNASSERGAARPLIYSLHGLTDTIRHNAGRTSSSRTFGSAAV